MTLCREVQDAVCVQSKFDRRCKLLHTTIQISRFDQLISLIVESLCAYRISRTAILFLGFGHLRSGGGGLAEPRKRTREADVD